MLQVSSETHDAAAMESMECMEALAEHLEANGFGDIVKGKVLDPSSSDGGDNLSAHDRLESEAEAELTAAAVEAAEALAAFKPFATRAVEEVKALERHAEAMETALEQIAGLCRAEGATRPPGEGAGPVRESKAAPAAVPVAAAGIKPPESE